MTAPLTRRDLRERTAPTRRLRPGRVIGEILLWVAAVAGLFCGIFVVLATVTNITLIMFSTGSMAPTIPAGSVAVVREIPASQIRVGDVVTVDRENQLPVTHRVTSVSDGDSPLTRTITMRGDANDADDLAPYTVATARLVIFSVPGIAHIVDGMGNPLVLGSVTLGASTLVAWAFWPRRGKGRQS